jgi:hypothetical protein
LIESICNIQGSLSDFSGSVSEICTQPLRINICIKERIWFEQAKKLTININHFPRMTNYY